MDKQELFPNFGNLTEGKMSGTLNIPIFGAKNKESGNEKKCAKEKSWENMKM